MSVWHISRCYLCLSCSTSNDLNTQWVLFAYYYQKQWLQISCSFLGALVLQNLIGLEPTILYSGSNHSITSWYIWQSVYTSRFPQKLCYLILAFLWELLETFLLLWWMIDITCFEIFLILNYSSSALCNRTWRLDHLLSLFFKNWQVYPSLRWWSKFLDHSGLTWIPGNCQKHILLLIIVPLS